MFSYSSINTLNDEEGSSTVEYAICTVAAATFAGLLLLIFKSDLVMNELQRIITSSLNFENN
ncbi:MAG: DUF4244 domain-containing protein [Candidatus Ancillula sp.]|nr:DUF4244 domain-containing protein [Candidatus Ancillula sp.]